MNELVLSEHTLSIEQIVRQRENIEAVMKAVMRENVHYGTVPGCGDKPSLFKPGAEIIGHYYKLRPEYTVEEIRQGEHLTVSVVCLLFVIGTDPPVAVGQGVGKCSSLESKYRYRVSATFTKTDKPVPKAFWDIKKGGDAAAKEWLVKEYGAGAGVKKFPDGWRIVIYAGDGEPTDHPNPPDVWNTVIKMARKRAHIDAVLTATAASEFFSQDLEDIRENMQAVDLDAVKGREFGESAAKEERVIKPPMKPPVAQPTTKTLENVSVKELRQRSSPDVIDEHGQLEKKGWVAWFVTFSDGTEAGTFDETCGMFLEDVQKEEMGEMKVLLIKGRKPGTWVVNKIELGTLTWEPAAA